MGLIAFGLASVAVGFAFESIRIAAVMYIVFATLTVLAITGVLPAVLAIIVEGRTERRSLDVEAKRVEATREIGVIESTAKLELQRQQHIEKMTQADIDQRLQLSYINADRDQLPRDTLTAANPTPAHKAVRRFLTGCYNDDGFAYPGDVNNAQGMLTRNPWTNQWRGEPWSDDARQLMEKYLLKRTGNGKQWALKHATLADAMAALPRL